MNRIISVIIIFFLFSTLAKAQVTVDISKMQNVLDRNLTKMNQIQGTPYLNIEYEAGTILSNADILYRNVPLRYDCFNDILEFKRNDNAYCLDPKETVKKAEFGGKVFVYREFEKEGGANKSYFEEVVKGKATLFTRYSINYHEAEEGNGIIDSKPARFGDLRESYYISIDSLPAKKILNNKKLVEILSDKKKEVEAFISKEKLSVKKKDDVKKIVSYYNSI